MNLQYSNPCKKCLIQACCSELCFIYFQHISFKNKLLHIPRKIASFFDWTYKNEPPFIKILLSIMLTFWLFAVGMVIWLIGAFLYVLCGGSI